MTYDRITYKSFLWKFGTTSFRSKEFNRKTEWQLQLLDLFWKQPENQNETWESNEVLQKRYYSWLHDNGFTTGNEFNQAKAAREKTSGLYDMGLVNSNRHLSEVGQDLLRISINHDFFERTNLGISKDSQLYLSQMLKLYSNDTGNIVRPLIVIIYLLSKLEYLTTDEFKYLAPLCTDENSTSFILSLIKDLRNETGSIDDIIVNFLLSKQNYKDGLERFCDNAFSQDLLLSVGMNRKSGNYDKQYVPLYKEMYAVYMLNDHSRIFPLFQSISKLTLSRKWKKLLFDNGHTAIVKKSPEEHILSLPTIATSSERAFKRFFFTTMQLFKAKATLEDYFDLNRRYLGLTNCFIFEDEQVKLDIVPKLFFNNAIKDLYTQAYKISENLFAKTSLEEISKSLLFEEQKIIDGINVDLGASITNIEEAYDEVDRIKYERFNNLINTRFTDEKLLLLLECFEKRNDTEINSLVTDNADIPTIFEYVLGVIWYKVSEKKGKVLDFLKLSLDANLLPVTHAAGGEADIVYEYEATDQYPEHSLLLEATLADSTNQRRMEMEPVSRHLGNHLLRTKNPYSYCVFATTFLHINVIADFMNRKHAIYYDSQDDSNYIEGMKIIPLDTSDLKTIIVNHFTYNVLYNYFEKAHKSEERMPKKWYDENICIKKFKLVK